MPRNFSYRGVALTDPRVVMRALIGILLAANLAAAIIAFKPFGGSADDLRRRQEALRDQLIRAQANLATAGRLAEKVQAARTQGDQFMARFIMDKRKAYSLVLEELNSAANQAGIKPSTAQLSAEAIEGSDTLQMLTVTAGFEGTYANLSKFVNLIDRSPRFLIIDSMIAAAPQGQGGKTVTVTLRIDAFINDAGADS